MLDDSTVGHEIKMPVTYDRDDTLLYNAAIGGPISTPQLVVERLGPVVAPTYAAVLGFRAFRRLFDEAGIEESNMLHLSQGVDLDRPLDPEGELTIDASFTAVWDKGSAAIVEVMAVLTDASGRVGSTSASLFVKGAGGFGGEKGPKRGPGIVPETTPEAVAVETVALNQTSVYRMCGDDNPLHVDPEVAAEWGFHAPIVHGLWTFAAACRKAICVGAGGEFDRISHVSGEFAAPLYLGETIQLRSWPLDDGLVGEIVTSAGERILANLKVGFRT